MKSIVTFSTEVVVLNPIRLRALDEFIFASTVFLNRDDICKAIQIIHHTTGGVEYGTVSLKTHGVSLSDIFKLFLATFESGL